MLRVEAMQLFVLLSYLKECIYYCVHDEKVLFVLRWQAHAFEKDNTPLKINTFSSLSLILYT